MSLSYKLCTSNTPDPKSAIQAELERIEEDCIHSGKVHFNAGSRWARYHSIFKS